VKSYLAGPPLMYELYLPVSGSMYVKMVPLQPSTCESSSLAVIASSPL
jgi:hypothetical protein